MGVDAQIRLMRLSLRRRARSPHDRSTNISNSASPSPLVYCSRCSRTMACPSLRAGRRRTPRQDADRRRRDCRQSDRRRGCVASPDRRVDTCARSSPSPWPGGLRDCRNCSIIVLYSSTSIAAARGRPSPRPAGRRNLHERRIARAHHEQDHGEPSSSTPKGSCRPPGLSPVALFRTNSSRCLQGKSSGAVGLAMGGVFLRGGGYAMSMYS